jgi:PIN domain nuclease of toxin-antitoxin system
MTIKTSLGKLELGYSIREILQRHRHVVSLRHIHIEDLETLQKLPLHHRDPFDRIIIAQALTEGAPIISSDAAFDAYGVRRIWE